MSQKALAIPVQSGNPPGTGMEYWGNTLPEGYIWQDGSFYEPEQYPNLFVAIGYIHGREGNKFKVPDKRGRVGVGAGQGSGLTNRALGQVFGEESVALSTSQIPSHIHGINDPGHSHGVYDPGHSHGVYDPGHSHGYTYPQVRDVGNSGFLDRDSNNDYLVADINLSTSGNGTNIGIYAASSNIGIYGNGTGISVGSQGGGGSHNNMPPGVVCNYIIKT